MNVYTADMSEHKPARSAFLRPLVVVVVAGSIDPDVSNAAGTPEEKIHYPRTLQTLVGELSGGYRNQTFLQSEDIVLAIFILSSTYQSSNANYDSERRAGRNYLHIVASYCVGEKSR